MANFEVKFKRVIVDKKGNDREIAEVFFLENRYGFGDAETQVQKYWNCECEVVAVTMSKVMEVINDATQEEKEELSVFKAILAVVFTDDDGNEKETKYPVLLWAKNVEDAMTQVLDYMKQGYGDMTLTSIIKTKIKEIL